VLDGVPVALGTDTGQVITVRRTSGTYARVTFWTRLDANHWVAAERTSSGRIGSGGLVAGELRHQGTNTTPTGTYSIPFGFGVDGVPGETYPYRRVTSADWWVEDNDSPYYNRWRDSTSGFRWWLGPLRVNSSEHLILYRPQYDLALVIGFNYDSPVHYRGAGIFLHVNGEGATAGCVSAPRQFVYDTIHRVRVSMHPLIAIG
jgi:L,D-peptidoglycan transpeptidase YkuD (ErfK/YbiS/YcfS/YnhG family)